MACGNACCCGQRCIYEPIGGSPMTTIPVLPQPAVSQSSPASSRSLEALLTLLILLTTLGQQAVAQSSADKLATFDIPAQSLEAALIEFSKQADVQVMVAGDVLKGHKTEPLIGTLGTRVALATLLKGTGLEANFTAVDNTVTVTPKPATSEVDGVTARPLVPRREQSTNPPGAPSTSRTNAGEDRRRNQEDDRPLEEIVVTGSHIRGQAPIGAPLIEINRVQIERSGFSTVQDVVRTLPQNFGGGPSEDTRIGNEATFNASRATGINLRGLGAGSTLVLLNGRRLAAAGSEGRFVDVSAIPLSAVERVEVLPDGASAIYGSDAIGGVVNIILRQDFEGVESRVKFGSVTDGAADELQLGQIFGGSWAGGNGFLALEYYDREALPAAKRPQGGFSDLRPLGGSNFDERNGNPGTIQIGTETWVIPRDQDGRSLTPSSFAPGTVNFHNRHEGKDLWPENERWSLAGTLRQEVANRVELFADLLYTDRDTFNRGVHESQTLVVPNTNAFYVNPTGGTEPVRVLYNFTRDLGPARTETEVRTSNSTVGATLKAGQTWEITSSAGYAREKQMIIQLNRVDSAALTAALADSNPATAFNPFGDGSFTNPATLSAVGNGTAPIDRAVDVWTAGVLADGTLWRLAHRDLKVALGADYRQESLDSAQRVLSTTFPTVRLDREVMAVFAELSFPLVRKGAGRPGLERFDLSLAGRYEDYSDFGETSTPKVGLEWQPLQGFSLRGSWSKSFRAPNLVDLDEQLNGSLIFPLPDSASPSGVSNALLWFGRNADLQEETATTWNVGAEFAPPSGNVSVGVSYFDIEFRDRVDSVPFTTSFLQDPQFSGFVTRNPSPSQIQAVCSRSPSLVPPDCTSAQVDAIVDIRSNNVAITEASGLDLLGSYKFGVGAGELDLTLNATYLLDFKRAQLESSPLLDFVDTQNNPTDLRARASLSWSGHGFGTSVWFNYAGRYTDTFSNPQRRVDAWTTVDFQLSYETGSDSTPWLSNTNVSLSVQNVFDEDPPFLNNPRGVGYDEENADLVGRFVSLQVRKGW